MNNWLRISIDSAVPHNLESSVTYQWSSFLVPPHIGLSIDSTHNCQKSSFLFSPKQQFKRYILNILVSFGVILFSFLTANSLSLELKQDAEHMSQVDILFWSKYCTSLQHCTRQDWSVVTSRPGTSRYHNWNLTQPGSGQYKGFIELMVR